MHYVYILRSKKDDELYTGCTADLKKRFKAHNAGYVIATRDRRPLKLVHYECFTNINDAFAREHWLKTGYGRQHLTKMLKNYLEKTKK
ncbi:MAG: GIY-YIG nuclease family protein [Candidatus Pacebacteria bacterium]|nr:GIY-YIG nuclease family protein [Candidatus Paceibacterota bacterium]